MNILFVIAFFCFCIASIVYYFEGDYDRAIVNALWAMIPMLLSMTGGRRQ